MKKILFLLCALAVTNVTFAQERANKSNEKETKKEIRQTETVFVQTSFTFDKKKKIISEFVIESIMPCEKDMSVCQRLMRIQDRMAIRFTTEDKSVDSKSSKYQREVHGTLFIGKDELLVKMSFSVLDKDSHFRGEIKLKAGDISSQDVILSLDSGANFRKK